MALNAAEEETLESVKKWWDDNGRGLLAIVVLALAGYGGWNFYQSSQQQSAAAASDMYEQIMSLSLLDPGEEITNDERNEIIDLAGQLRQDYSSSVYALFAALFSAQQQVALGDLEAAAADLRWVLDNVDAGLQNRAQEGVAQTASLRLGRLLLSQEQYEEALEVVNSQAPGTFEAAFAELRGDIYMGLGRSIDARESYLAAQQAGSNSDALRMKLDSLQAEG